MDYIFTPGCALMMYKPQLAEKAQEYLKSRGYGAELSLICCHHDQQRHEATKAVVVCSGCARRFAKKHELIEPVSLWQIMAQDQELQLPDYEGLALSIHDACPSKNQQPLTEAVRQLLRRMNINIVEAEYSREKAHCCGDSFQGKLTEEDVLEKMKQRAAEMPTEQVVVYCISCIKSMVNGGKKPRFLLDLIFGEETLPGTLSPNKWHEELQDFIKEH